MGKNMERERGGERGEMREVEVEWGEGRRM